MTPQRFARLCAIADRRQPDLTVLMDDVERPHNVSAVIRTCDAVGVVRLHAVAGEVAFRTRAASAKGAQRYVDTVLHADRDGAIAALQGAGLAVLAAHPVLGAVDFRELDYTLPTAILLGAEREGVHPAALAAADGAIVVPMLGAVSSLNVSVAAAVILFEAQRQRLAAGMYDSPRLSAEERHRLLFEWAHPRLAEVCRRKGWSYPRLTADGELLDPMPRG